jgi:hypothetical protein
VYSYVESPTEVRTASERFLGLLRKEFTRSITRDVRVQSAVKEKALFASARNWFAHQVVGSGESERIVFEFGSLGATDDDEAALAFTLSIPLSSTRAQGRNAFFVRNKTSDELLLCCRLASGKADTPYDKSELSFFVESCLYPVPVLANGQSVALIPIMSDQALYERHVAHLCHLFFAHHKSVPKIAIADSRINLVCSKLSERHYKKHSDAIDTKKLSLVAFARVA